MPTGVEEFRTLVKRARAVESKINEAKREMDDLKDDLESFKANASKGSTQEEKPKKKRGFFDDDEEDD